MPTALWHTLPLHYVPHLLYTGALCSQAELARRGYPIRPRRTAARRDRKLRLDGYVHLSPVPVTSLLKDKCARGYPHALLAFDVALLSETNIALCRFNAKSWRHRDDFAPVADSALKDEVWAEWRAGRYPSLEILVSDCLPLTPHVSALHLPDEATKQWVAGFEAMHHYTARPEYRVTPELFPGFMTFDKAPLEHYQAECQAARTLLPPPDLPFD